MQYSLVICTYNPNLEGLELALQAINNLDLGFLDHSIELILVDNNSEEGYEFDKELKCITNPKIRCRVVKESNPGLMNARIKGFKNALGKYLVYIDDDNILAANYLKEHHKISRKNTLVKAWGPGRIEVIFQQGDKVKNWIKKYTKGYFQEKNLNKTQYGIEKGWPKYYPAGTGLIIKKEIIEIVFNALADKKIQGREKDSLASGEDSQIIWTINKIGYPVGSCKEMKLKHFITNKKSNFQYLKNLNYNLSKSYHQVYEQFFETNNLKQLNSKEYIHLFFSKLKLTKGNIIIARKLFVIHNAWHKGLKDAFETK